MRRLGSLLFGLLVVLALAAPLVAPNPPARRFPDLAYAPPTRVHLVEDGRWGVHIHPLILVNRLERRFAEDGGRLVPLRFFVGGRLASAEPDAGAPLLLLGADGYGRDVWSRVVHGARITLALALFAAVVATLVGAAAGATAGYMGGWVDGLFSRGTEFLLVLPSMYVALALRAVMPLVLPAPTVFVLLSAIFIVFGAPVVARGVRAIVLAERERDYVRAAEASGARASRVLARHLLPAALGFAGTQATLLVPAFVVAEATLSYVGLGFPDSTPTWGTMLQESANVSLMVGAPWILAPALAIFLLALAVNLVVQGGGRAPVQLDS